jgi:hypothetical protein
MNKKFLKPLNDNHYTLDEAIKFIKEYDGNNVGMRLQEEKQLTTVVISKNEIIDGKFKAINLPAWQYLSKNWEIVVPDLDRCNKTEEVRDFMMEEVPGFELDSRFYNEEEMDIDDWFNRLHDWLFDEDVKYKIFMFLKEKKLLDNAKHF